MKKIPLTQGLFAIIDDEDYDWLMQWKWYAHKLSGVFYADRHVKQTSGKKSALLMHRAILGLKTGDGKQGDHINHDCLDNRRSNVRICTVQQNQFNQNNRQKCTSKYKGVHRPSSKKNWKASIHHNGKCIHIGYHATEIEAARAYDAKAHELFGEFAKPNFERAIE